MVPPTDRVRCLGAGLHYGAMVFSREHWLANPSKPNNRFFQPFAVLSYCWMLHPRGIGVIGAKRTGAEWAQKTLINRWPDLIECALDAARETPPRRSANVPITDAMQCNWRSWDTLCGILKDY